MLAAVQRMWWEAETDVRLKPYLPPGGLTTAAREVLRRLERTPVQVKVKAERTGETVTVTLGREDFQRAFFRWVNPANLLSVYHERYDAWASSVLAERRSREAESQLIGR